ncbi:hypothetical protein VN12_19980 [Pirellula sp. SH-Sr6A]|uniref:Wadjet anti-phage system protein JetD domain-containing protein n=1 Tax=Pirellula sp. SH-Sr6A TaxID=1632865 RepID=UPI00078CB2CC|nr:Wadjet anti-phage system protein JetD domain-containing protein [Pirellula sp. SH-Sr6A]AMV34414.1 hypothetical protein VN12_19980 [Pirellula sp. SH-Sr6A]
MKSPEACRRILAKQWESPTYRETRLLGGHDVWPISIPIGRPPSRWMWQELDRVKRHIDAWRNVRVGEVLWKKVRYRAAASDVEVPFSWRLHRPSEWIDAIHDRRVRDEFDAMAKWVEHSDPLFHRLLIRRRSLWTGKPEEEVIQALRVAEELTPGCAEAQPLRSLGLVGTDTKFFERHSSLIAALLDERFEGEVSRIGLEDFLGAYRESEHWLLVYDMDGGLLPYRRLRIRSVDLSSTPLPGDRVLLIENESCLHQLPACPGTIAVLGTGFDLGWTDALWLRERSVGYWGDLDTWGLAFLAKARRSLPHLQPLLMTSEVFGHFQWKAVREPVHAGIEPPVGLTELEQDLYRWLLSTDRGRLEQEFLSREVVHAAIRQWQEPVIVQHNHSQHSIPKSDTEPV